MVTSDHNRRIHVVLTSLFSFCRAFTVPVSPLCARPLPLFLKTHLQAHRTRVSLMIMMSIMLHIATMATGDSPSDSHARTLVGL